MRLPTTQRWFLAVLALGLLPIDAAAQTVDKYVYVRSVGGKFEQECMISITRGTKGWAVLSVTGTAKQQMQVTTSYDDADQPLSAQVTLIQGETRQQASIDFKNGKATVRRSDQPPGVFDAPKETIVTSAPDWTDVFLLCKRYDRIRKGKQEFPAIWAHPTHQPLRLTFAIEQQGSEIIEHNGKKVVLGRYGIRIRNNSAYVAWADADGRLIRLMPAAAAVAAGLTLQGYEQSAAKLQPAP